MTDNLVDTHLACLRANWPDALQTFASTYPKLIDIPRDLSGQLLSLSHGYPLCELIEPEMKEESSYFLKVAGFSFREAPIFHHCMGEIENINTLRLFLREIPARVKWGLRVLFERDLTAQIELYPWREMDQSSEFRCFISDGNLVGISQYDSDFALPIVDAQARQIERALRSFVSSVLPNLHIPTLSLDVHFEHGLNASSLKLIELNPFGQSTDLCLFGGAGTEAFDGRFLYCRDQE